MLIRLIEIHKIWLVACQLCCWYRLISPVFTHGGGIVELGFRLVSAQASYFETVWIESRRSLGHPSTALFSTAPEEEERKGYGEGPKYSADCNSCFCAC